ncbi:MAG TPA: hypothetical protein VGZ00_11640 [Candidatus Baltobacteraceae bacterium]|nr:hypothetical protein [Candidatus Baltobacteraceae bacterium]
MEDYTLHTPPSLAHLIALSDDVGVIQHAFSDVPNRSTGYCVDDVARAFLVSCKASEVPELRETAISLGRRYLAFLLDAQRPDGCFRNFMGYDRRWQDDLGSEDAQGRAISALGYAARFAPLPSWRDLAASMVVRAIPQLEGFHYLRGIALAAAGLVHTIGILSEAPIALRLIEERLLRALERTETPNWVWFEEKMTYDNARLSAALLHAGIALENEAACVAGLRTLDFYENLVFRDGMFVPIGNRGWSERNGNHAIYAQQPLEVAATIDAERVAFTATGDAGRVERAREAWQWFLGRNLDGRLMIAAGGCYDGLDENGHNRNMGAESSLAYLQSAFAMRELDREQSFS